MTGSKEQSLLGRIVHELRHHAPFTFIGTLVGIGVILAVVYGHIEHHVSEMLFGVFHPLHVLLSAIVTTAMYRLYGGGPAQRPRLWAAILVGYVGAIGIGTVSDSLIPFLGETLLGAHDPHVHAEHAHIGFIDLWWLVNPLALAGVAIGYLWPRTRIPHAGHVLLSTAASLFHMSMALEHGVGVWTVVGLTAFLFLAVWLPCCTSDIVFPLLFVPAEKRPACRHCRHRPGEPASAASDQEG